MRVLNSVRVIQFVFHALNAARIISVSQIPTVP
jgi:hypothetical protein